MIPITRKQKTGLTSSLRNADKATQNNNTFSHADVFKLRKVLGQIALDKS